jgi:hypothetical protein
MRDVSAKLVLSWVQEGLKRCIVPDLWTYDSYGAVRNAFDAGGYPYITRELGPGNQDFFGTCELALSF